MNRQILFRAKRADNDEWAYGDLLHLPNGDVVILSDKGYTKVKPETVGQFTGLSDDKGNKIFDGDIIRYADIYDYNCYTESIDNPEEYEGIDMDNIWTVDEVAYGIKDGYPAFDLENNDFEVNGLCMLKESCQYFYEVIGNIYDNPELLE